MALIFAVSSLTAATIERASSPLAGTPFEPKAAIAHVVEFWVLAVLAHRLMLSYGISGAQFLWPAVLLLTVGYAATDELHQSFVPGRDPSLADIGYDALGALAGLAVAEMAARARRRGRNPN